jgi:acetyl-CoA carboxylase carboxyltransferase component
VSEEREQWQQLLAQLRERQLLAEAMGGPEKVTRQHQRGRLTARERIDLLFDPGSFNEIGALAGGNHPGGQPALAGDGVIGGTGRVNGRSAVVLAEDFTVKGGSIGHANAAKRARLVRLAQEQRLPLVILLDGAGERAANGQERYPSAPNDLQLVADLQGQVPVVALVLGASAGHGALTGMFADFIIMLEGAFLFTAGPPLVQAALGIETTPEELGSARMHATQSGVVHNLAATEREAFDLARAYLAMMPQHAGAPSPASPVVDAPVPPDTLLDLIPPAGNQAYDMRRVIAALVDTGSLLELQPDYGGSLICALARFSGEPCLVVANQPATLAGAITCEAAEKAAHFMTVAGAFGLPLVTLVDNPGVMPGAQSEQAGVLKAAGRMFAAQRRYRGCKIVVTLRKAFGFGSSVMGMNPWDRQAISLALPSANLGGVPAIGGAQAAKASAGEAARMEQIQSAAWVPADAMAFDKVVSPADLRDEIIAALQRG